MKVPTTMWIAVLLSLGLSGGCVPRSHGQIYYLKGTVIDALTREPVAGATVRIIYLDRKYAYAPKPRANPILLKTIETDTQGRFQWKYHTTHLDITNRTSRTLYLITKEGYNPIELGLDQIFSPDFELVGGDSTEMRWLLHPVDPP